MSSELPCPPPLLSYEVSIKNIGLDTVHKLDQVRWGEGWKRDDGSNTTWVSSKNYNDDIIRRGFGEKFERALSAAAAKKAKSSQSIDLKNTMLAWPHDRATAERAEAREEKLAAYRAQHADEYDPETGHLIMDWDSDIIRLGTGPVGPPSEPSAGLQPEVPAGLRRRTSLRSESRTLLDAGTPQPIRVRPLRPVRQSKILHYLGLAFHPT